MEEGSSRLFLSFGPRNLTDFGSVSSAFSVAPDAGVNPYDQQEAISDDDSKMQRTAMETRASVEGFGRPVGQREFAIRLSSSAFEADDIFVRFAS